ncbi:MAG: SGNH/GDSL hydrolase family protein [Paludibacter sp.]|nr:SGNH/GDSL hydrolase family protein [Bacteroidales bacterium]MCM1068873.1 SGNH/GDSL hydrolase family protein [Prevotella sp.]MCM1353134.1 SGNH/GDSL hydrolase family protein [Bacteroides sp.]MCM1442456.1 SGNH/GDSL hydrolase family protein [Muribaculum sp.]MCM1481299.1 SGNH/GDSL hydrolase family protein [Paludibacter sp.]
MKYRLCLALTLLLSYATLLWSQETELRYVNALEFRIINKGFDDSLTPFTRIPAYLKDSVRTDLWERAKCSTGMAVRFATDSKCIGARYNLLTNMHMAHMADTGIKGTDLYRLGEDGKWHYVNTARPTKDSIQHKVYVSNMEGEMHEYMIYLPLYDGINWLEIGVDSTACITQPQVDNPRTSGRIVFYGTSVMQGGCATRTGMAATCMIQRDLNVECVNIGISGEGKMDYCMARAMAQMEDVLCYVIDPVPNCTKDMCDTLTYNFVNIIRQAKPDVPIVMVEGLTYPYAKYDAFFREYLPAKNEAFYRNYQLLLQDNPDNLYYMTTDGQTGLNEEGTVDGIHLTDIGFRAYADRLEKILERLINQPLK